MDADLLSLPKGEVLQAAGLPEAGLLQAHLDAPLGAAVDLVGEDDLQEGGLVQLLPAGQGDALGQGGGHGPQLQTLEQRREIGGHGHVVLIMPYGDSDLFGR